MKTHQAMLLSMLVGFGLGGLAIHGLHAQVKPPAYTIAEIEVTDAAGYQEYTKGTTAAVPGAGGRFIVRGGKTFVVNGAPPKRIAVIQWDSYEQAQAFHNSDAYKKLIPIRDRSSNFRAFVVEGASN